MRMQEEELEQLRVEQEAKVREAEERERLQKEEEAREREKVGREARADMLRRTGTDASRCSLGAHSDSDLDLDSAGEATPPPRRR